MGTTRFLCLEQAARHPLEFAFDCFRKYPGRRKPPADLDLELGRLDGGIPSRVGPFFGFSGQLIYRAPGQAGLVALIVWKRRYTRDSAHFIRASGVVCAATARNIVCRSRYCRGLGFRGATASVLKRLICCPCSACSASSGTPALSRRQHRRDRRCRPGSRTGRPTIQHGGRGTSITWTRVPWILASLFIPNR